MRWPVNLPIRAYPGVGLAVLVLAACAAERPISPGPSAEASSQKRITTRQGFRSFVVGKIFRNELGSGRCLPDGTMTGTFDGRNLTGYWYWEDQYFCRNIKVGNKHFDSDCQILFVSGDELTVVRNRGEGETVAYRLFSPES